MYHLQFNPYPAVKMSSAKAQGSRRVIFGPVKSQNVTERKNPTSCYTSICNLWLTTGSNMHENFFVFPIFRFFYFPKDWQKPSNIAKIFILAPFSVINSL